MDKGVSKEARHGLATGSWGRGIDDVHEGWLAAAPGSTNGWFGGAQADRRGSKPHRGALRLDDEGEVDARLETAASTV